MFYLQQSYSELHSARVLLLGCQMELFQTYFFLKGDGQSVRGLKADTQGSCHITRTLIYILCKRKGLEKSLVHNMAFKMVSE